MDRKKEELFINQLLDETYKYIPESDSGKDERDLFRYFSQRSENLGEDKSDTLNYIKELSLAFERLEWQEQTKCYRLKALDQIVDIPSNWGPFENFNVDEDKYLHIKSVQDQERLTEAFSSLFGQLVEIVILVGPDMNLYIGFIEQGRDESLKGILELSYKQKRSAGHSSSSSS